MTATHPSAAAGRNFDPARSALIFIEFQNEWLDEASPLNRRIEDRAQFDTAVRNATVLIETTRRTGFPIAHAGLDLVKDPTYLLFGGGKDKAGLRGAIPRAGRWRDPQGVASPEPFTPRAGEFVVAGRSGASALLNSTLDAYLRNNRIDRLFLAGFVLHVCVESTLRHGHDLGYDVTVVEDAAPAFTAAQRDHVLTHVVPHFGRRITTAQFVEAVEGASGTG
ncbi:cysteine hydrolase [Roseomonas gilardii]|uniref:cysteine hydrolase n=1 Tax=Roseomonas gilardii TaxID=257708 RepID=UPI0011A5D20A|nr:cysteine hydrolase family protein [Roseomonas gilardii]